MIGMDLRQSGIDILGDVPWGTHFCHFYKTREDLLSILVPYFKAGLANNEFCIWVTEEPLSAKEVAQAMTEAVPDFASYVSRGQIEIVPHDQWYLRDGVLDLQKVLDGWLQKLDQALARGYDGMRLSGNTIWLKKKDWKKFTDYEASVNSVVGRQRMIALCTYSLESCSTDAVFDVMRNHGAALIRNEGEWEIIETSVHAKTREALREREEHLRAVLNASSALIVLLDRDGTVLEANEAQSQIMGLKHEEVLGRSIWDLFRPDIAQRRRAQVEKVLQTGAPLRVEDEGQDGRWYGASLYPVRDAQGVITGVAVYSQDITEAKRADDAVRGSEELYRHMLGSTSDGIFVLDGEWRYVLFNEAYTRIVGLPKERLPGRKITDLFPGIEETEFFKTFQRVMETGVPETVSGEFTFPDGRIGWYDISVDPVPEGILCIARDISEQKRVLDSLGASEEKYHLVVENAHEAIVVIQIEDASVLFANKEAEEMSGYSAEELMSRSMLDFIHPDDREMMADRHLRRVRGEDVASRHGFRYIDRWGNTKWVEMNTAVFAWQGRPAVLVFLNDITERWQAERALVFDNERREVLLGLQRMMDASEKEIVDFVLEGSVKATRSEYAFVGLLDDTESVMRISAWSREAMAQGAMEEMPAEYPVAGAGIWTECVRQRRPVIVNDFEAPDPGRKGRTGQVRVTRFMGVPVFEGEQIRAVVAVANGESAYDESGSSGLRALADRMWGMIRRRRAEQTLRLENERRGVLLGLQGLIDAPEKEIFDYVVEGSVKSTGSEFSFITLMDEAESVMTIHGWSRGAMEQCSTQDKPIHYPVAEAGIWAECVRQRRPVLVNDYEAANPAKKGYPSGHVAIRRFMSVPVFDGDRIVAVAAVANKQAEYDESDANALSVLTYRMWGMIRRRRAEDELRASVERYRSLYESIAGGVVVQDRDGVITEANAMARENLGLTTDEITGRTSADPRWRAIHEEGSDFVGEDHPAMVTLRTGEAVRNVVMGVHNPTRDEQRWILVNSEPIRDVASGETQAAVTTFLDITDRRKMIEELRLSEERYRLVVENTHEAVAVIRDGEIIFVNTKAEDLTGYPTDELVSRSMLDFIHPDDQEMAADRYVRRIRGEKVPTSYEIRLIDRWGQIRWAELNVAPTQWNGEGPVMIAFLNDITERKKAEDELKASEERYRLVVENAHEAILVIDDDRIVFANAKAEEVSGYTVEELASKSFLEFMHPDELGLVADLFTRRPIEEDGQFSYAFRFFDKSGKTRWVQSNSALTEWRGKQAILAFASDVTERKKAEDELKTSEERYRLVVENTYDAIAIIQDGRIVFANRKAQEWSGYPLEDALLKPMTDFIHPDDRHMTIEMYDRTIGGVDVPDTYEFRFVDRDGRIRLVEVNAVSFSWEAAPALLAFLSDITERRKAEDELKASEEKYRRIVETASEGIVVTDEEGRVTFANSRAAQLFGYSVAEMMRKIYVDFVPRKDIGRYRAAWKRHKKGASEQYETCLARKDGSTVWTMVSATPLLKDHKQYGGTLAMITDITGLKETEKRLRESQKHLRTIFDSSLVGIMVCDMKGKISDANDAFLGITGYTREDLKKGKLNRLKMTPADYEAATERAMREMLENGYAAPFEKEYLRKDGSTVAVMVGAALMGADGGAPKLVCVVLDITRVKKAEEALARDRNMLRAIMENTEAQLAYLGRDFKFLAVNSAYARGSRQSAKRLIGRNHFALFPDPENQAIFERVRDTGETVRFNDKAFAFADQPERGTTYWDWSLVPVKDSSGKVDGMVLSMVDTTERVRIEDELMKHRERLESLVELRTRNLTRSYDMLRKEIAERKKVEEELRRLSNRLVECQEEERKSLARELHDEIGQSLTIVKLFLDRCHAQLQDETFRRDSVEVRAIVKKLMEQVRTLSLDLRPTMLDDLGLMSALQWHFNRFTDQSHVQVNFKQSGLEKKKIPPEVGTAAYRIVQEALTNVARYANVAEAMVSIEAKKGLLRIEVEDHGAGFDMEKAVEGPGAGLSGIRERVIALNGTLTIESAEGAGTYVLAELPLPDGAGKKASKAVK